MAVTYATALKTNRMQLVADLIDTLTVVASSGSHVAGKIVIGTSAMGSTIVTIPFNTTCGTVTSGVLNFATTPTALSAVASLAGTNTAAAAVLQNNAGTGITTTPYLTVGTGGTDIILNSTSVTQGQTVTLTSGSITHG